MMLSLAAMLMMLLSNPEPPPSPEFDARQGVDRASGDVEHWHCYMGARAKKADFSFVVEVQGQTAYIMPDAIPVGLRPDKGEAYLVLKNTDVGLVLAEPITAEQGGRTVVGSHLLSIDRPSGQAVQSSSWVGTIGGGRVDGLCRETAKFR